MGIELTNEELYDLLKKVDENKHITPSSKKKRQNNKSVVDFISVFNIEAGNVKVPTYKIFYEYYVKWVARNRATKLGRHGFFREFAKHFELYRIGRQRYYMLNDCFDMSKEELDKAYRHRTLKKKDYIK